jgi:hypothetical protein
MAAVFTTLTRFLMPTDTRPGSIREYAGTPPYPGVSMGTYRTLTTTLPCRRCSAAYPASVQWKTGDDSAMPDYQAGDVAADVAPGVYEGVADTYCAACGRRWVDDEKRLHFELLAADVAAGRVTVRRATWRHGSLDGRPELGLVITLGDEAPLSAAAVRALVDEPEGFGWPSFTARLSTAQVAVWAGDVRLLPHDPSCLGPSMEWWKRRHDEVLERLCALGWPDGGEQWIDVGVRVDEGHRVELAT